MPAPASPVLLAIRERGTVRAGISPGFAPFALAGDACPGLSALILGDKPSPVSSADGRPVAGLDVDLAAIVAQSLGARLEVRLFDRLDAVFDAIGLGDVDVGMGGITRTLQRAASLAFSQPYLVSGLQVFAAEPSRFPTVQALSAASVRLGVKAGTTGELFARQSIGAATIVPFASNDDSFLALRARGVDAVVADALVGRDMILHERVPQSVAAVENRRFTNEPIAMAAKQGDPDWQAYLSLLVHEVRSDGRFHELAHRYNAWLRTQR